MVAVQYIYIYNFNSICCVYVHAISLHNKLMVGCSLFIVDAHKATSSAYAIFHLKIKCYNVFVKTRCSFPGSWKVLGLFYNVRTYKFDVGACVARKGGKSGVSFRAHLIRFGPMLQ